VSRPHEKFYAAGQIRTSRKVTDGFDYKTGQPVHLANHEWRQRLRDLAAKGGYVKVQDGETWGMRRTHRPERPSEIEFEIYGYVK
jgi:hypothetical protein